MTWILNLLLNKQAAAIGGGLLLVVSLYSYHKIEINRAWNAGYKAAGEEAKSLAIQRQLDLEKRLDALSKMPDDELRCSLIGGVFKDGRCSE